MSRASQDNMRNANMLSLMRCVRDHEPVSKNELKEFTNLSWGSISSMTAELVRKHIFLECPRTNTTKVGRTPSDVLIDPNYYCIIGIELNIGGISAVIMNLNMETEITSSEPVRDTSKDAVLSQVFEMTDRLYLSLGERKQYLLGIGIAMQGAVDAENGVSIFTPYFKDWRNINLQEIFSERYHVPAYLEHSPNCQALYEKQLGVGKGFKDIVYVRISASIGMSVIINDMLWRGADGNAGELGHIIVNPGGRKCVCGRQGCLETVASSFGLLNTVKEHIRDKKDTFITLQYGVMDPDKINFELIYNAACRGDPFCVKLFQDMGTHLGSAVSAMINLLNPTVVIFGGDLAQYESLFFPTMKEVLEKNTWDYSNRNVIFSKSHQNTATIGAALIVANRFYDGEFTWIFSKE